MKVLINHMSSQSDIAFSGQARPVVSSQSNILTHKHIFCFLIALFMQFFNVGSDGTSHWHIKVWFEIIYELLKAFPLKQLTNARIMNDILNIVILETDHFFT